MRRPLHHLNLSVQEVLPLPEWFLFHLQLPVCRRFLLYLFRQCLQFPLCLFLRFRLLRQPYLPLRFQRYLPLQSRQYLWFPQFRFLSWYLLPDL